MKVLNAGEMKWISVKDKLPTKKDTDYLVTWRNSDDTWTTAICYFGDKVKENSFYAQDYGAWKVYKCIEGCVEYWMPLPESPETDITISTDCTKSVMNLIDEIIDNCMKKKSTLYTNLTTEFLTAEKERGAVAAGTLTARELAGQYLHYYSFADSKWLIVRVEDSLRNIKSKTYPLEIREEALALIKEALTEEQYQSIMT